MNCVILQPSYIPWRGYFHQIALADVFVFYDDVKYDKNGWRNRNRIKTPTGSSWLSIPVLTKGVETNKTPINQIRIDWSTDWAQKHWNALSTVYAKAPYYKYYSPLLQPFYQSHPDHLADFTIELTIFIARQLGITHTQFLRSSQLAPVSGVKTERLINILSLLGATHYISGPSARDYIKPDLFTAAGIQLTYVQYEYPEYPQLYPPYDPQV
ncbi:MAG: WbqC family protein, partial [Anaerolineaceae bacterium]|nr:WbqC family protein [Anaerolineaceae bacterium]